MSKFIIHGGKKLAGTIRISGNKNAILPIMTATILVTGDTHLTNVPQIKDVEVMCEILKSLGARVEAPAPNELLINTEQLNSWKVAPELAKKLRASVLLLGPLLARFGHVELPHPGGDIIGKRSVDTHLSAFAALGASVKISHDTYMLKAGRDRGGDREVFLTEPSVTGTENIIMACTKLNGTTVVENAAMEPHVTDLIDFLTKSGAHIEGRGTNRLTIHGGNSLHGISHRVVPDHIEVGTFAIAAALTKSTISITPALKEHLHMTLHVLSSMGVSSNYEGDTLTVKPGKNTAVPKRVQTGPWPSFPTDLMSPLIVLCTQLKGETLFHDPLYESRMFFVDKLIRMGAQITICDPHRVIVYGPTKLRGNVLNSPDIRAGVALVLAALIAEGESSIDHAEIIERGYEQLEKRLSALGADITKV